MKTFAKIFESKKGQVLLTKGYDSDEDQYTLTQTTYLNGIMGATTMSFQEEEQVDKAFDDYREEDAKAYQKQLDKLLKE